MISISQEFQGSAITEENNLPEWLRLKPAGDTALVAYCGDEISETVGDRVAALAAALRAAKIDGAGEIIPAFSSLLVSYNPLVTDFDTVAEKTAALAANLSIGGASGGKIVEIPVCYGGEYGEDLPDVAAHAKMTEEEVIAIHSGGLYRLYMIGFLPGFPYLGGLDERIACPRLKTPRTKIPAGAVGIGGSQTGIYPLESPGGWRLIGRTPLVIFDPSGIIPLPYAAGDRIKFVPIDADEYERIAAEQRGEL